MSVSSVRFRCAALLVVAGVLGTCTGCNLKFEHDPAETVTLEITKLTNDADRDQIQKVLKGMTDGSSHVMTSSWSGDSMTVRLSPVSDVKAFARKINFGEVTAVDGRTITVEFVP